MNRGSGVRLCTLAGALGCCSALIPLAAESPTRAVLIKAPKPYDRVVAAIEDAGGRVTHRFRYVDGLAAEVPDDALAAIEALVGAGNIGRDEVLLLSATKDPRTGERLLGENEAEEPAAVEGGNEIEQQTDDAETAEPPAITDSVIVESDAAAGMGSLEPQALENPDALAPQGFENPQTVEPQTYTWTSTVTELAPLHASGNKGENVVIAIIDSGYRATVNSNNVVTPLFPHIPAGRIIVAPGVNFVPGATEPPAISTFNDPHGTQVAGIAAANRAFCLSAAPSPIGDTSRLVAVAQHYGIATVNPATCSSTSRLIQMVGSAPNALILPMKVIPRTGGGAPASRVIQAIEKAIALRQGGINIQVVNLSLGGPTNAAARTLVDMAIDKLLDEDIVPVISAGNDGFSSVTISSPATSLSSLTVGAASDAIHERIFRAQFSAPCNLMSTPLAAVVSCTIAFRPDNNMQMAEFSSRGPTHDGRIDPHVVTNAVGVFTQGTGTGTTLNWVNGTSFASPWVAGIAAVLRQAVPEATARQIRNALIMSADRSKIPTATANDQGAGLVNAKAALDLLKAGRVPDTVATMTALTRSVPANMERAGRPVYENVASVAFTNIRPAEIADLPFLVPPKTGALHVRIHSILPSLPVGQQNQFFGDDVFLRIQSAAVHRRDRRVDNAFLAAGTDTSYSFVNPEPGIWRITPSGDWTNAGSISFTVEVWTTAAASPQHTAKADILEAAQHVYSVAVPPATATLDVRLDWLNMEARYPFSDLDVILTPPVGAAVNACNTARAPERCTVTNPAAGIWTVKVVGVTVPTFDLTVPQFGLPGDAETYTLRLAAGGAVLPLQR